MVTDDDGTVLWDRSNNGLRKSNESRPVLPVAAAVFVAAEGWASVITSRRRETVEGDVRSLARYWARAEVVDIEREEP